VGFAFSPYEGTGQPGLTPLAPPPTAGGDAGELGLEPPGTVPPVLRDLDWHAGELRGGSGGGGGGFGLWGTKTNSITQTCIGTASVLFPYFDHSAAGGGGGGGALQVVAGRSLSVDGQIDASGGHGGGSLDPSTSMFECVNATTDPSVECGDFAAPGGGGSGGALKLQGLEVELAPDPARLSVLGGMGGVASSGSIGGDGGPGLVRIESVLTPLLPEALAPSIAPYYPGDLSFNQPYVSAAILSLGDWVPSDQRPDSFSAGMSCWIRSDLGAYELHFVADDPTAPGDPDAKGWNMDVLYETPGGVVAFPYRGIPNDPAFPLTGIDFQGFLGQLLNHDEPAGEGSLFCVRFQGARAAAGLTDPCDVDLHDGAGEIVPGSLTPWVRHPAQLELFDGTRDMIRFVVVFDASLQDQSPIAANIRGVTDLRIRAQPD
jgi:hypothetical protein